MVHMLLLHDDLWPPHLIDGEANGVHVLALTAVAAPVLLHESHQEAAGHLIIFWVIIFLQQCDLVLGIDPIRVYSEGKTEKRGYW